MHKFGITMRITNATGYDEPRDTIAMDWSNYMLNSFPEDQFIFIPNLEDSVIDYINNLGINALILSGGDDLGVFQTRDKTEFLLLEYALKMEIPVIAICRGLQLVHTYFGGILKRGSEGFVKEHRSTMHLVDIENSIKEVNSYHTNYIDEESVNEGFEIFARCELDNSIEGLRNNRILGMMWHPERDPEVSTWNKLLIKDFLNNEE
jgi:N5-(cytidine 5'-diphosphoramidyl)-L-glutamine hydrolase